MNDCAFRDDDITDGCYHHQDDLANYQLPITFEELNNRGQIQYRLGCHHCLHHTAWWPTEQAAVAHWNRINTAQMRIQEYRDLPDSAKQ